MNTLICFWIHKCKKFNQYKGWQEDEELWADLNWRHLVRCKLYDSSEEDLQARI